LITHLKAAAADRSAATTVTPSISAPPPVFGIGSVVVVRVEEASARAGTKSGPCEVDAKGEAH
jgi:hypothetical protein